MWYIIDTQTELFLNEAKTGYTPFLSVALRFQTEGELLRAVALRKDERPIEIINITSNGIEFLETSI